MSGAVNPTAARWDRARRHALGLRLEEAFEGVRIAHAVATPDMYDSGMFPEESEAVARAVPSRRREFAAGRAAARSALMKLGKEPAPLLADRDRVPIWPRGFVGSISHCEVACCALAARRSDLLGVGVDLELAARLEDSVGRLVVHAEEVAALARMPTLSGTDWATVVFSAKEAFYKAYFPSTRIFLSFLDVVTTFTLDAEAGGTFEVRSVCGARPDILAEHPFVGRWNVADGIVLATAAIMP